MLPDINMDTSFQGMVTSIMQKSWTEEMGIENGKMQSSWRETNCTNTPHSMIWEPKECKKVKVHIIFDVKHDGRHEAHFVAGGYLTPIPVESVYSGVISLHGVGLLNFFLRTE